VALVSRMDDDSGISEDKKDITATGDSKKVAALISGREDNSGISEEDVDITAGAGCGSGSKKVSAMGFWESG